jgi:hypothetical protein
MKPSDLRQLIETRFKAGIRRPLHVESSPGLGKTQIPAQIAKDLGIGFIAIHAPLLQPEDYGFPVINQTRDDVDFVVSRTKFPIESSKCPETGILLIDELSQADNSAQKILANLIQEREIHGQHLKPGWMIITTGNRTTDRAGANRLLSHLKNRLTTIELEPSLDDWTNWALSNDVKTEVISFIRFRPGLLSSFDPQQDVNPTPRSWTEGVSAAFGIVNPAQEFQVFKGDVGEGPAAEFCAFLKIYRNLPNPDLIVMNPKTAEVPKDPATMYALTGALSTRATTENFVRILEYMKRLTPEFTVLFVRDALHKTPGIANTKEFITWAAGDGAKLLS